jgi:hypothetical protein
MGLYNDYAQVATIVGPNEPWFIFHTLDGKRIIEVCVHLSDVYKTLIYIIYIKAITKEENSYVHR